MGKEWVLSYLVGYHNGKYFWFLDDQMVDLLS